METNQEDIDLIERYIHGKLTPAEVDIFENRLGADREFARKYRLRKTFPEMMHDANDPVPVTTEKEPPVLYGERLDADPKKSKYLFWGAIAVIMSGILIYFLVIRNGEESTIFRPVPLNDSNAVQQVNQSDKPALPRGADSTIRKPVELNSPDDGVTFSRKDQILFTWELETDTFTNLYVFSENNHKLVWWRGIKPGIRENNVPAINFLPGKFYWYVGNKEVKRTFVVEE